MYFVKSGPEHLDPTSNLFRRHTHPQDDLLNIEFALTKVYQKPLKKTTIDRQLRARMVSNSAFRAHLRAADKTKRVSRV